MEGSENSESVFRFARSPEVRARADRARAPIAAVAVAQDVPPADAGTEIFIECTSSSVPLPTASDLRPRARGGPEIPPSPVIYVRRAGSAGSGTSQENPAESFAGPPANRSTECGAGAKGRKFAEGARERRKQRLCREVYPTSSVFAAVLAVPVETEMPVRSGRRPIDYSVTPSPHVSVLSQPPTEGRRSRKADARGGSSVAYSPLLRPAVQVIASERMDGLQSVMHRRLKFTNSKSMLADVGKNLRRVKRCPFTLSSIFKIFPGKRTSRKPFKFENLEIDRERGSQFTAISHLRNYLQRF